MRFTFADLGGSATSFAAKLLSERGAARVDVLEDGDIEALASCDVVLDCGTVDYERLCAANPQAILVSITGFGLTGPKSGWKADSYVAAAAGGSMGMCGLEGRHPLAPAGEQAQKVAGLYAANGIMLALMECKRTGEGKHLDISLQECVASALDLVLVRSFYYGEDPHRTGSIAWGKQNFIVPCSNGHIMVHFKPLQWQTLVDWMDGDGMASDLTDPMWADARYRDSHFDHVVDVVGAWSRTYEKEELFETAQMMRMAWAIVAPAEVCGA